MPNHMKALDGAIEVMYDEFYDKLRGYSCVLDLGGYIWESAVRLAQMNTLVVVYEPHPENYRYLLKNIAGYKNIRAHNLAVVGKEQSTMTFYGGAFDMGAWNQKSSTRTLWREVTCINILDVLAEYAYDALKMDIEGAEYECLDQIMTSDIWTTLFRKLHAWFIEFHFYKEAKKIEQTQKIIQRITSLWYHVDCFDAVTSTAIQLENLKKYEIIFIYFTTK